LIAIGFGSNQGDRLFQLSEALRRILQRSLLKPPLRFSSIYSSRALLPAGAPADWAHLDFLNAVVVGETDCSPDQLWSGLQAIEKEMGRERKARWAPRMIDLDLLFYHDLKLHSEQLQLPHPEFKNRAFVVEPLRELGVDFPSVTKDHLDCRQLPLKLLPSELVSIINLTPDSFSDGNLLDSPARVLEKVREQVMAGASVIDIGAESTRPGAASVSEVEEWSRLEASLQFLVPLKEEFPWVKWSLDCRRANIWKKAVGVFGFDFCNDVSGGEDSDLLSFLREFRKPYIFMHHLGIPVDRARVLDPMSSASDQILLWVERKIESLKEKISADHPLIFDPGIGFGKTAQQSVEILANLEKFKALKLPIYIGHSRKSFLSLVTEAPFIDRDLESSVISAQLATKGVAYLRVHDVEMSRRAIETQFLVGSQSKGLASA
jgi:2-amino-4-hydroxy-6-hydroxymethyldihydropteridine diphosphokinase/dihydropteroate synthase